MSIYFDGNTEVRKTVGKLLKTVSTKSVGGMFVGPDVAKWCKREVWELQYSTNYMQQNCRTCSKKAHGRH